MTPVPTHTTVWRLARRTRRQATAMAVLSVVVCVASARVAMTVPEPYWWWGLAAVWAGAVLAWAQTADRWAQLEGALQADSGTVAVTS